MSTNHNNNKTNTYGTQINLNASCWGSILWTTLEIVVAGYPEKNVSPQMKSEYRNFFYSIGNVLPCDFCRNHYRQNMKKFPIDPYLGSRRDLAQWLYALHNQVNKLTGKTSPPPSFEKVFTKFDVIRTTCDDADNSDGKTCGPGTCPLVMNHIIEPFSASSSENVFTEYWPLILIIIILLFVIAFMYWWCMNYTKKIKFK